MSGALFIQLAQIFFVFNLVIIIFSFSSIISHNRVIIIIISYRRYLNYLKFVSGGRFKNLELGTDFPVELQTNQMFRM